MCELRPTSKNPSIPARRENVRPSSQRKTLLFAWILLCFGISGICAADSIHFGGKIYEGVYVREGRSMYYIQTPWDGRAIAVPKAKVAPRQVVIDTDPTQRAALHEAWKQIRALRSAPAPSAAADEPVRASERPARPAIHEPSAQPVPVVTTLTTSPRPSSRDLPASAVTDGYVPRVRLQNVPLSQALDALLRPLGLDYSVEKGFIWISTPKRIRSEPFESLETRYYEVHVTPQPWPSAYPEDFERGPYRARPVDMPNQRGEGLADIWQNMAPETSQS